MRYTNKGRDLQMERLTSDKGAGEEAIVAACDGDDLHPKGEPLAHALGEFLRRIIAPGDCLRTSRRFVVFASIFSPELLNQSFRSMAPKMGCTRAALSKIGITIRKEFNLTSRGAKPARAINLYRLAQLAAVAGGRHASQRVKARNAANAS